MFMPLPAGQIAVEYAKLASLTPEERDRVRAFSET
jgi:hypothetical protein